MGLIEEIKKTETEAEKIKRDAEQKGIRSLEQIKEELQKRLDDIARKRTELLKKSQQEIEKVIAEQKKLIEEDYARQSQTLGNQIKKNMNKAIEQVQEIILKWQQSH
jgi:F0F1-type ATP synthase membrane subunit b/b'